MLPRTRDARVIFNAARESIFFFFYDALTRWNPRRWMFFCEHRNRSELYSRKLYGEKFARCRLPGSELLSISTADRCRNNQREFLPHACFFERIAIPRSVVIHSDYFSRKESPPEIRRPLLSRNPLNRRDSVVLAKEPPCVSVCNEDFLMFLVDTSKQRMISLLLKGTAWLAWEKLH